MLPARNEDKQLLPERVARQIEAMILDGSLAVGHRLPAERELCQKLSVSRNSLREALKELRVEDADLSWLLESGGEQPDGRGG